MSDPWTALSASPDLLLVHAPIAEPGRYYHRLRTIVLRSGMRLAEQRSVLWHEMAHAERGDEFCCGKGEAQVERLAARRAIPLEALADALLWSDQPDEVADDLKVTVDLLRARLEHLHPAERGYLRRRFDTREESA